MNKFREAVVELIVIDMKFNQHILINLFLNTLSENLPVFHKMVKRHVEAHDLNFIESLDYAASQAYFYMMLKHSNEPTELASITPNEDCNTEKFNIDSID